MCQHGNTRPVYVKIPADLSCTGGERWKHAQIDSCIADIVEALQQGGIDMRGSCCGHGKQFGDIQLQDGRVLLILTPGSVSYDWVKTRVLKEEEHD
jgi:hypothetical protein